MHRGDLVRSERVTLTIMAGVAFLLLVAVVWPMTAQATPIKNASFEEWNLAKPVGWSFGSKLPAGGVTFARDWTHSGIFSVSTRSGASSDKTKVADVVQDVNVTPGYTYKLSVWVVSDRNPSSVQLLLRFLDGGGKEVRSVSTTGKAWSVIPTAMRQMKVAGVAPSTAVKVRMYLRISGGYKSAKEDATYAGRAAWDDAALDASPTTTVSGLPNGWRRTPVTLTFSVSGSGMRTEYRVDNGTWTTGNSVTIPAPADHSNDGAHPVQYRSIDSSGQTEDPKTATVRIDTRPPTPRAKGDVSVSSGGIATVPFLINDACDSATVKIQIRNTPTNVVKTYKVGKRATGKRLTAKFRCTLGRGWYKYFVLATDSAGNSCVVPPVSTVSSSLYMIMSDTFHVR
jgi:hypothetical protein